MTRWGIEEMIPKNVAGGESHLEVVSPDREPLPGSVTLAVAPCSAEVGRAAGRLGGDEAHICLPRSSRAHANKLKVGGYRRSGADSQ